MKTRVISAIILTLIFIPFLYLGGIPFASLMLVLGIFSLREMLNLKKDRVMPFIIQLLAYLSLSFLILVDYDSTDIAIVLDYKMLTFLVFALIMPIVLINDDKKYNIEDALYVLGSVLFLGLSFNLLVLTRNYSLDYLLYFFAITISTDVFAFVIGKLVGIHKLAKDISPNKTIEGLIGGTVMGTFIPVMFYITVIDSNFSLQLLLLVTISLSLISQLGDLVFSAIKRHFKIKDFSNMIPGHGGILDRFDSIIFVILGAILFLGII